MSEILGGIVGGGIGTSLTNLSEAIVQPMVAIITLVVFALILPMIMSVLSTVKEVSAGVAALGQQPSQGKDVGQRSALGMYYWDGTKWVYDPAGAGPGNVGASGTPSTLTPYERAQPGAYYNQLQNLGLLPQQQQTTTAAPTSQTPITYQSTPSTTPTPTKGGWPIIPAGAVG